MPSPEQSLHDGVLAHDGRGLGLVLNNWTGVMWDSDSGVVIESETNGRRIPSERASVRSMATGEFYNRAGNALGLEELRGRGVRAASWVLAWACGRAGVVALSSYVLLREMMNSIQMMRGVMASVMAEAIA